MKHSIKPHLYLLLATSSVPQARMGCGGSKATRKPTTVIPKGVSDVLHRQHSSMSSRRSEEPQVKPSFFAKADAAKRAKVHGSLRTLFHRQPLSRREVQLLQGRAAVLMFKQDLGVKARC